MSEENKALVRRFYEEVLNNGNFDVVDELSAADFVDHNPPPGVGAGLEGVKQAIGMYRSAFPDLKIEVEEQVAEGNLVVSRLSGSGTHTGEFMGIPPTGRRTEGVTTFDMIRIVDGKAVERWGVVDQASLMMQLGVMPQTGE